MLVTVVVVSHYRKIALVCLSVWIRITVIAVAKPAAVVVASFAAWCVLVAGQRPY